MNLADLAEYRRTGDPKLKAKLLAPYLDMVRSIAFRTFPVPPAGMDHDDLVSCGNLGLLEALEKFEPDRGYRFSTFAYYKAKGAMHDAMRRVTGCRRVNHTQPLSLDDLLADTLENHQEPLDEAIPARLDLAQALRRLRPQDRELLAWRFDEDLTLDQIGERLGPISGAAVCNRLKVVTGKLREALAVG